MHNKKAVTIAVDAMGGDRAPDINVDGVLSALADTPDLNILLVGDRTLLLGELSKRKANESERLKIIHSEEVISMEDHAASVMRRKKKSSIHIGLQQVKEGTADAFVSAGHSGAVMASSILVLGRIADVERPAIVVKLPTAESFVILLDAGANVDCKPSHLFQFAEMGRIYAQVIEGIAKPKVGLLSNGSEEHKGNELTRETNTLLRSHRFPNYIGYVEGYDLFKGTADVVVCDGFVGNVTLKLSEGLADAAIQWLRKAMRGHIVGMVGLRLLRPVLRSFRQKIDYQSYGAAPLLGIDGMVLISHGSSTEVAIRNGILTAKKGVEQNFVDKVRKYIEGHAAKGTPSATPDSTAEIR